MNGLWPAMYMTFFNNKDKEDKKRREYEAVVVSKQPKVSDRPKYKHKPKHKPKHKAKIRVDTYISDRIYHYDEETYNPNLFMLSHIEPRCNRYQTDDHLIKYIRDYYKSQTSTTTIIQEVRNERRRISKNYYDTGRCVCKQHMVQLKVGLYQCNWIIPYKCKFNLPHLFPNTYNLIRELAAIQLLTKVQLKLLCKNNNLKVRWYNTRKTIIELLITRIIYVY